MTVGPDRVAFEASTTFEQTLSAWRGFLGRLVAASLSCAREGQEETQD